MPNERIPSGPQSQPGAFSRHIHQPAEAGCVQGRSRGSRRCSPEGVPERGSRTGFPNGVPPTARRRRPPPPPAAEVRSPRPAEARRLLRPSRRAPPPPPERAAKAFERTGLPSARGAFTATCRGACPISAHSGAAGVGLHVPVWFAHPAKCAHIAHFDPPRAGPTTGGRNLEITISNFFSLRSGTSRTPPPAETHTAVLFERATNEGRQGIFAQKHPNFLCKIVKKTYLWRCDFPS